MTVPTILGKPSRLTDEEFEIIKSHTVRGGDILNSFKSLKNVGEGALYHFQVDGPFNPTQGDRFDGHARLIDPYAKALVGDFLPKRDGVCHPPKCVVVDDEFDWDGDYRIRRKLDD